MPVCTIEEDGDRAVVMDLDQHMLLEATSFDIKPSGSQELGECVHKRLSIFRGSSLCEAGATSLAGAGEKGELADYQRLTSYVQ